MDGATVEAMETKKNRIIYEVYMVTFTLLYVLLIIGIYLSGEVYSDYMFNIMVLGTIIIGVSSFFVIITMIKARTSFMSATLLTVATTLYMIGIHTIGHFRYVTVSQAPMIILGLLLFMCFSKVHLVVYLLLSLLASGISASLGVGQSIILGSGYPLVVVGYFLIVIYVLVRGIRLFREYERPLYQHIEEMASTNQQLSDMNEQLIMAEDELEIRYNEIQVRNEWLRLSGDRMLAILNGVDDGYLGFSFESQDFSGTDRTTWFLGQEKVGLVDGYPSFYKYLDEGNIEIARILWDSICKGEIERASFKSKYRKGDIDRVYQITILVSDDVVLGHMAILEFSDISEKVKNDELLTWKASHNDVTGLLNRDGFIEQVSCLMDNSIDDFYLMLFDVNDFKFYNTTFGYNLGDKLLREIGNRISQLGEGFDNYACLGGDSFMMTVKDYIQAEEASERIVRAIETLNVDGVDLKITGGIGIGLLEGVDSATELIQRAEIAMFETKKRGRDGFAFYDDSFNSQMQRQFNMAHELENAIENGEFTVVFQPQVEVATEKIKGYEVLSRWTSKTFGVVSPAEFIPLAERTGLIVELGKMILDEALTFTSLISLNVPDILVTVNISPRQLLDECFVEYIKKMLAKRHVSASNVGFEITETAFMENIEKGKDILGSISNLGIKILLDDFGTGYSSLSYLDKLPIDVVKIDKSFIDEIHTNDSSRKMLRSVVSLCEVLGLETVAEGVENMDQYRVLNEEGCSEVQGYYFGKPMPARDAITKAILSAAGQQGALAYEHHESE